MTLTEQEAKRITPQLDIRTAMPARSHLVFVFGTRLPKPAYLAADLINRGIADTAVLTGRTNRLTGEEEADTHLEILLSHRVPRARIIVENASTNTLENVTLALTKIHARLDLERIESIILVTKWYHCRRASGSSQ